MIPLINQDSRFRENSEVVIIYPYIYIRYTVFVQSQSIPCANVPTDDPLEKRPRIPHNWPEWSRLVCLCQQALNAGRFFFGLDLEESTEGGKHPIKKHGFLHHCQHFSINQLRWGCVENIGLGDSHTKKDPFRVKTCCATRSGHLHLFANKVFPYHNEAFKKSPKFSKCSEIAQSCANFVGLGGIGGSARSRGKWWSTIWAIRYPQQNPLCAMVKMGTYGEYMVTPWDKPNK